MPPGKKWRENVRDAATGRYVKKEEAEKRPNETVTERELIRPRPKKKRK